MEVSTRTRKTQIAVRSAANNIGVCVVLTIVLPEADGADLEIEVWNMAEEDSGTEVFVQLKPIYPTGKLFIDWEACDE